MIISDSNTGDRLDRFLAQQLPNLSRSLIQNHIKDGSIIVNEKTVMKSYILKEGDEIKMPDTISVPQDEFSLEPNKNIEIDVIEETKDYVVINKTAGLVVHPGSTHLQNDTLVNGMLAHYPELATIGEDPMRPGIVHRLDKDVSGIMVIARTKEMLDSLKQQFKKRAVTKIYTALVHGILTESYGEINLPISRSLRDRSKMAAHTDGSGKSAYTEYSVIQQFQHYALLSLQIHTGRTHQIRVHCNAIGHPIVGDNVYKPKNLKSRILLNRLFLHAEKLEFKDMDDNLVSYAEPIPKQLQAIVDDLYSTI